MIVTKDFCGKLVMLHKGFLGVKVDGMRTGEGVADFFQEYGIYFSASIFCLALHCEKEYNDPRRLRIFVNGCKIAENIVSF